MWGVSAEQYEWASLSPFKPCTHTKTWPMAAAEGKTVSESPGSILLHLTQVLDQL